VEQSSLSIRRTLAPIGIPRSTFYDWYSRYQEGGIEALEDVAQVDCVLGVSVEVEVGSQSRRRDAVSSRDNATREDRSYCR